MNFEFSQDQYMLRDSVRRYLAQQWGPRRVRAAGGCFDAALWNGLAELGVPTLLVPPSHAGSGLGLVDAALVLEEFGRALVPAPMAETMLAAHVLALHGSPAQRDALLPDIANGKARVGFAHVEPAAGYDLQDVQLSAQRHAGAWRLSGRKLLVAGASAATHLLVSARAEGGQVGLFLCEAGPALVVQAERAIDADALLASVEFDAAQAAPIGDAPDAPAQALALILECMACSSALQMAGVAGAALEMAVAYAKQRVQFDRPIGSFQAIKHKCADMLVAIEGARTACYHAAWALDAGDPALAVSMAKASAGDACRLACNEALQIHGGVGFTWEFDIHLFLKRGKLLEYAFGDAAAHRERIATLVIDRAAASAASAASARA